MTEPVALLLVLFLIYLSECIELLPEESILVRPRKQGRVKPAAWVIRLSPSLRVSILHPIPWFSRAVVLTRWPIAISPIGVSALPKEREDPAPAFSFDELRSVSAERSELILNKRRFPVGSEQSAKEFAALIEKLRSATNDRRGRLIEEALRRDVKANLLQRAYARLWSRTWWLRVACTALFLFVFAIAPVVIALRGITHTWPVLLLVLLELLALTLYEYWRTHRLLFPDHSSQRRSTLVKMALAPTAAMRAVDGIQRELTARFNPVAALAVPGNQTELLRLLHERQRAEPEPQPESNSTSSAVLRWFWALETDILEGSAAAVGIRPQELSGPPIPSSPAVRAYCPRCREQYVRATGGCADCPGATLIPFDAPT